MANKWKEGGSGINKTIRWGIIGCGDVTEIKSGPALQMRGYDPGLPSGSSFVFGVLPAGTAEIPEAQGVDGIGSHTLDLLDYLHRPIRDADGHASNTGSDYQAEDTVSGRYVFESGVHGTGIWCFTSLGVTKT